MIEKIDSVTMQDVRDVASAFFAPQALSVAGVGPAEESFLAAIEPLRSSTAGAEAGAAAPAAQGAAL
jgi:hypothetical protein